ncbi:hypothetical protein F0L68_13475 [Solihabitans fulvus]|uniref:PH domain-containing protein n=1 Tax=Solihabitans fulvus TaxID=1892852 RepID=A0A5B2XG80_9PSEU|nr:hypothetical protein [Solihabitans fulvus]KAA2262286.1 hypothetical protein F0L68_13475 [Solihabitans fulvus]
MSDELSAELGELISRHRVDNKKQAAIGGWAFAIGLVLGILAVVAIGGGDDHPRLGSGRASGFAAGLALCGLVIGGWYLFRALRAGSDEYIEVREHGLVHATRKISLWSWDLVSDVRLRHNDKAVSTGSGLGVHYWCTVLFKGGGRISFNGLTDRHVQLGKAILANVDLPVRLRPARKELRWWWLAIAAVCVGAGLWIVDYINSHPDTEQRIAHSNYTELVTVPGIGGTGITVLSIGLVVVGFGALFSLVMFVRAMVNRR